MIPRVPGEGLEQAIFAFSLVLEKGSGNSEIECLMEDVRLGLGELVCKCKAH